MAMKSPAAGGETAPPDRLALDDARHDAAALLRRLHGSASGRYRALEERLGISVAGARLLLHASRFPDSTVSETAERMDLRPSTVSNLARALEERSLIARSRTREDQRSVRLRLTADGQAMIGSIGPDAEFFLNLLSKLSDKEAQLVHRAMKVLAGYLSA